MSKMIKYEIRKLLRRPIFLFMLLISLGIQIVCALSWLDEIRPESAYRQLLQEYAACSLDEAVEKITLESASAEDSHFRNYEAEYEAGEITIDEYRGCKLILYRIYGRNKSKRRNNNYISWLYTSFY